MVSFMVSIKEKQPWLAPNGPRHPMNNNYLKPYFSTGVYPDGDDLIAGDISESQLLQLLLAELAL